MMRQKKKETHEGFAERLDELEHKTTALAADPKKISEIKKERRGSIKKTQPLKQEWLKKSYNRYTNWLWDTWGYSRNWNRHLPEMILWYSTAGSAVLSEGVADKFLILVLRDRIGELPSQRKDTWLAAKKLTEIICVKKLTNPVDWFTGHCGKLEDAWTALDDLPNVGPKIASFIMRDLSFMRDYSKGLGKVNVAFKKRIDRSWYENLSYEDQALFFPIDRNVLKGILKHAASNTAKQYSLPEIQSDKILHWDIATEVVIWARERGYDPRDLNIYWYTLGAGKINRDGTFMRG